MSYWVAVVARNAEPHLKWTLHSLINQSEKPERIVVIDDGSTDGTSKIILQSSAQKAGLFKVLTLPDHGYDIRRVPHNINLACKIAGLATDYFMVSGDDCTYPTEYARGIIARMQSDPRVVVASGSPRSDGAVSNEHSPSGSGRMIRSDFWRQVGGAYPVRAGWETWLLYKALQAGFRVQVYNDLVYHHIRPRGAAHQFTYWGAAMEALGYHPLYALGRIAKSTVKKGTSIAGSLSMLKGYVQARLGTRDPFVVKFNSTLRDFVRRYQAEEVVRLLVRRGR